MSANRPAQRVVDITLPALLDDEAFCRELSQLAGKLEVSEAAAREEATSCIDELAIQPRDRYLNWSARLARFMYSRSYERELDVDRAALEKLQEQAKTRPLVFLWSHKSHLDSFVFLRAIYDGEFRPQPLSFAGINMSFAGFGTLARNAGAIFLRRSFKGADIYKLVFRHYVRYLVAQRAPLSWSIEGTRSRTGKLMPPKPGLLQWVLEALDANGDDSALFVPVSITFDQIAEIDDYIAINRGEPKRKESLGWFLGYIFGMQKSVGSIHVRFGEPVSLQEQGEVPAALLQTGANEQQAQTLKLALEVSRRIEHNTLITPQSLVCLALLASEGESLDLIQLKHRLARLQEDVAHAKLPCAAEMEYSLGNGLPDILAGLANNELLDQSAPDSWSINADKALGASYYRNTISHYFLYAALGELALAQEADSASTEAARQVVSDTVLRWRDLLKFEYVLVDRKSSTALALAHLDRAWPDWESSLATNTSPFNNDEPLYARGILKSVLGAYHLFFDTIQADEEQGNVENRPRHALQHALQQAGSLQSAASLPLMENADRLCAHMKLADGTDNHFDTLKTELANALRAI